MDSKNFTTSFLQLFAHFCPFSEQKAQFIKLLYFSKLNTFLLLIFCFQYCNFAGQSFNNYTNGK